jgi:phytanoyl-CoA hydroxylase
MTSAIGSQRKGFWETNGFLVFPGFFTDREIDAVNGANGRAWIEQRPDVIVDDLVTGRRCRIGDLDEGERRHRFKVNDLYLTDPDIRQVALSDRLGMVLEELLGDEPTICNTLNFDKGSQQADHLDTLYMTPVTDERLVATWMALEDAELDSGLLRYYPESNRINPYRFSSGSMHEQPSEMARWSDYMASEVERHGLQEQRFQARKGDLFIWHSLLLHGGSHIGNPGLTRRSLVTHYWTQTDCETRGLDLRPVSGGWWIHRPPHSVPPDDKGRLIPDVEEEVVDFPASLSTLSSEDTDLRDRMDALEGVSE